MTTDRVFESLFQWNLYGSNGRTSLGGDFRRAWRRSDGSELILAEMSINASWLDRTADKISFIDVRRDFAVSLPQVVMSGGRVEELVVEVVKWLESPRDIVMDLCSDTKNQDLVLSFTPAAQISQAIGVGEVRSSIRQRSFRKRHVVLWCGSIVYSHIRRRIASFPRRAWPRRVTGLCPPRNRRVLCVPLLPQLIHATRECSKARGALAAFIGRARAL